MSARKKTPEELLATFELNGRNGKTVAMAIELLKAFGFEIGNRKSHRFALNNEFNIKVEDIGNVDSDFIKGEKFGEVKRACQEVLVKRENSKPVVQESVVTKTIFFPEAPEFRATYQYNAGTSPEGVEAAEAKVSVPLKQFVDEFVKLTAIWKTSYALSYNRDTNKQIITMAAPDAGVFENKHYGDRNNQQIADWAKGVSEQVMEVYMARYERLGKFLELGGHKVEGEESTYKLTKTGKDTPFKVTYVAEGCIDQKSASVIELAIKHKIEAKEKAARAISAGHARRRAQPAGEQLEGASFADRIVTSGSKIISEAIEAKRRLQDLLLKHSFGKDGDVLHGLAAKLKVKETVLPEYFDPNHKRPPSYTTPANGAAFRSKFLDLLKKAGVEKSELRQAEADFRTIQKEIPRAVQDR